MVQCVVLLPGFSPELGIEFLMLFSCLCGFPLGKKYTSWWIGYAKFGLHVRERVYAWCPAFHLG